LTSPMREGSQRRFLLSFFGRIVWWVDREATCWSKLGGNLRWIAVLRGSSLAGCQYFEPERLKGILCSKFGFLCC
jgi:hypothetical protein